MQPSIFSKFLPKADAKAEYFLTLEIQDDKVKTAACELKEGEIKVLSIGTADYSGTWEEITIAVDEALSSVEGMFPQEVEINKVILGLPTEFTKDGKIEEGYLASLKKILLKLSLSPLGFVEIPLAIIHFLQNQEGGPQTLILVRVGKQLTVSLVRVGKITNNINIERTENLALDFEKAVASFTGVEILPSRILLYDGQELEKARQELMNYPWLTKASFLHFPKIEAASSNLDIESVAFAAGKETAQRIEIVETEKEEPLEPESVPTAAELPSEELQEKETSEEAQDFGFVKGEDVGQREPQNDSQMEPSEPVAKTFTQPTSFQEPVAETKFKVSLPRISFAPFKSFLAMIGQRLKGLLSKKFGLVVFSALVLFLLAVGSVLALWYYPTAQVNLILESQILQQPMEINLNARGTTIDEANKEIPALNLETEEKEVKKATTTGKKTVGEPAKGEVTLYNKTTNSKTFKKGTVIVSPNNLKFTLDDEVSVASASENVGSLTFGKQNVKVTATNIGPEGNLGVSQEFHFADFPTSSYAARNEVAFSGGTSREISVVARVDQEKLLTLALTELNEKAKGDLSSKLGPGEKLIEKTLVGTVTQKKFDKEVDEEANEINLDLTMHFTALGYKENDLLTLLEKSFAPSIPSGFEFKKDEVKLEVLEIQKKKDGNLVLKINFTSILLPQIDTNLIKKELLGKSLSEADKYLRSLGNLAGFEVKFGRQLPLLKNIFPRTGKNINIETSSRK